MEKPDQIAALSAYELGQIVNRLDGYLHAGRFDLYGEEMERIDPMLEDPAEVAAYLRVGFVVRHLIPGWRELRDRAGRDWRARGLPADKMLRGLEDPKWMHLPLHDIAERAARQICDTFDLEPDIPINEQSGFGSYETTWKVVAHSVEAAVRAALA